VIDGQDIAGVSLESLRSKIGFVTQDTPLFDGTITENVTYSVRGAASEASEEQIQRAARLAGVAKLGGALPPTANKCLQCVSRLAGSKGAGPGPSGIH